MLIPQEFTSSVSRDQSMCRRREDGHLRPTASFHLDLSACSFKSLNPFLANSKKKKNLCTGRNSHSVNFDSSDSLDFSFLLQSGQIPSLFNRWKEVNGNIGVSIF